MKIHLNEMVFYGHHGIHPEERTLGQRFLVDFTCETEARNDRLIRQLEDTIDYTKVYNIIKDVLENQEFHLLEDCANMVLDNVMERFTRIILARVRIRKPSVPIKGPLNSVEIEMERSRA